MEVLAGEMKAAFEMALRGHLVRPTAPTVDDAPDIFRSPDRDKLADALDKKWEGPVPYTVLIAPGGKILYRKHDSIDPLELKKVIVEHLGRTYASR